MEQQQPESPDAFREFEGLLRQLRERVDALDASGVDTEQLQQGLRDLDELAGRAAAALDKAQQ